MTESDQRKEHYIAAYKTILQSSINGLPSGLRQKIALALGKHKSFVSQITNPNYSIPIPVQHLDTIFAICRFSQDECEQFLEHYILAHPEHKNRINTCKQYVNRFRTLTIHIPVLEDPMQQKRLEASILEFTDRAILEAQKSISTT